jgi:hypothetical protein
MVKSVRNRTAAQLHFDCTPGWSLMSMKMEKWGQLESEDMKQLLIINEKTSGQY